MCFGCAYFIAENNFGCFKDEGKYQIFRNIILCNEKLEETSVEHYYFHGRYIFPKHVVP